MSDMVSATKNQKSNEFLEKHPDRGLGNLAEPLLQIIYPAMRAAEWISTRFHEQVRLHKDDETRLVRGELRQEDLHLGAIQSTQFRATIGESFYLAIA